AVGPTRCVERRPQAARGDSEREKASGVHARPGEENWRSEMKRISLRRALSLRVGGGAEASRNTEGYELSPPQQQQQQRQPLAPREAAGEGPDEGHRQQQQQPAMQQAPTKKAEMMNIDAVSSNAYSEGRGEDPDMPPQLAKLGENMDVRRDRRVQSSRVRPESIRLFEASASQSHHGVASRGVSG
ncbi:unnamed protein product, partial [Ectocarpus sp. 13 AM-2016]